MEDGMLHDEEFYSDGEEYGLHIIVDANIFDFEKFLWSKRDIWSGFDLEGRLIAWEELVENTEFQDRLSVEDLDDYFEWHAEPLMDGRFSVRCFKMGSGGRLKFVNDASRTYEGVSSGQLAYDYADCCEKENLLPIITDKDGDFVDSWEVLDCYSKKFQICQNSIPVLHVAATPKRLGEILSLKQRTSEAYEVWLKLTKEQRQAAFDGLYSKCGVEEVRIDFVMKYIVDEYSGECFDFERVTSYDADGKVLSRRAHVNSRRAADWVKEDNERMLKKYKEGKIQYEEFRFMVTDRNADNVKSEP